MRIRLHQKALHRAQMGGAATKFQRILDSGDRSELRVIFGRVIWAAQRGGALEEDLVFVRTVLGCAVGEIPQAKELRKERARRLGPLLKHNESRNQPQELKRQIRELNADLRKEYPSNQHRYRVIRKRLKTRLTPRQINYICTGK